MDNSTPPTHILLVDDEPDAMDLQALILQRDGYRISRANGGQAALDALEESLRANEPAQLMLLDLMMPGVDGRQVLSYVRRHPRLSNLLVMVVTAAYSPEQEVASLEAGADDFIGKPFSAPQLLARVRTLLRTRRAEDALSRAQALSRLLIEGMHDMVFAADERGRLTYVSPSAQALTGYTADELTSGQLTLEWLVHPGDHERVRQQIAAALQARTTSELESRLIRRDGTLLWAAVAVQPMQDTTGLQGIVRDVTVRHQTEETLRARTQELAALNLLAQRIGESLDPQAMLSETLGTLIDVVDGEFGLVYSIENEQPRIRAWHGLPPSILAQAESPDFLRQLRLQEIRRERRHETAQAAPDGAASDVAREHSLISLPLRHRSQQVGLLVLASRDPQGFDDNQLNFLAAAAEQIGLGLRNAQLYAEAQRRASELELISQATHAASSTLDMEKVLQAIMSHAIQVLQAAAGSVLLLDQASGDLVFAAAVGAGGDALRGVRVPLAASLAGQAVRERRSLIVTDAQLSQRFYRAVDQTSGLTTHDMLAVPLNAHGHTIGVIEVINKLDGEFTPADLALLEALSGPAATAIENARLYEAAIRHAEEIQQSQQQLIRSEKLAATGRLAVSLAHEINNPLQALRNLLFISLEPGVTEIKRTEFLEMASEETSRLITLVQQTLEFYRPAQPQAGPVDINAAVERVLALARKKLANNDVQAELALAQDLPRVNGMSDQLAQVFLNLIVNAAEAMSDGGQLRITSRLCDNQVELVFADTGPGIAPEVVAHIFEPFYTTKDTGTGLGLAVSYNIIESHQGTLSVASIPGHGATFTVRLPALDAASPAAQTRAAPAQLAPVKRGRRKSPQAGRATGG
jgi:PAS domain S-box-containing protein